MDLPFRFEQFLLPLRIVFGRTATFEWFILHIWGIVLRDDSDGVTSGLRALGLPETVYHRALHFFHSEAFSAAELGKEWTESLLKRPDLFCLRGQPVFLGDGLKVAKEGRKMPAVKLQHQESGNVSKPEYIYGHYFGSLNLAIGQQFHAAAVPVSIRLEDGLPGVSEKTLVDRMADNCLEHMPLGSYAVLDSYFAAANLIQALRKNGRKLITRVRSTTVACGPVVPREGPRKGRPPIWGPEVRLSSYFQKKTDFTREKLVLYGDEEWVEWRTEYLYWDSSTELVQFVWVRRADGSEVLFLTTDLGLTAAEVIETYCFRFKIELCFRTMHQLFGAFDYHFWMKDLPLLSRRKQKRSPQKSKKKKAAPEIPEALQKQMRRKIEAYDRYVTVCGIALGILQLLALEVGKTPLALGGRHWMRTVPQSGFPSERMMLWALVHELTTAKESRDNLILAEILERMTAEEKEQPEVLTPEVEKIAYAA